MTKAAQEYLQSKGIIMPDEKRRYRIVGDVYILDRDWHNYNRLRNTYLRSNSSYTYTMFNFNMYGICLWEILQFLNKKKGDN